MEKSVQHAVQPDRDIRIFKFFPRNRKLNLIQQNIIGRRAVFHKGADIQGQFMRGTVFLIDIVIQRQRDDMLILYAIFFQIFRKQFEQQKAFAATANTGYHLDQTIIAALN